MVLIKTELVGYRYQTLACLDNVQTGNEDTVLVRFRIEEEYL